MQLILGFSIPTLNSVTRTHNVTHPPTTNFCGIALRNKEQVSNHRKIFDKKNTFSFIRRRHANGWELSTWTAACVLVDYGS
jgi:hypothetical protein